MQAAWPLPLFTPASVHLCVYLSSSGFFFSLVTRLIYHSAVPIAGRLTYILDSLPSMAWPSLYMYIALSLYRTRSNGTRCCVWDRQTVMEYQLMGQAHVELTCPITCRATTSYLSPVPPVLCQLVSTWEYPSSLPASWDPCSRTNPCCSHARQLLRSDLSWAATPGLVPVWQFGCCLQLIASHMRL